MNSEMYQKSSDGWDIADISDSSDIPSSKEGALRRSRKCHATLESAQRGRSDYSFRNGLTSPAAPISEGSESSVRSARPPLLEGGDMPTIPINN